MGSPFINGKAKKQNKNKTKKKVECHVAQKHSTTSQRKAVF
jgi:hypothetical protein